MSFDRLLETAIAYRFACLDRDASKKRFTQPHEAFQNHEHMALVAEADKARHDLVHAVLALDVDTSVRINSAMISAYARGMGIEAGSETTLPGNSLADLVGAARFVKAMNRRPAPAGGRVISTIPGDRLIAAIYAAANYEPVELDEDDRLEPVVVLEDRAVAVVAR